MAANSYSREDISNAMRALNDSKRAQVMLLKTRPPFANRNGRGHHPSASVQDIVSEELDFAKLRKLMADQARAICWKDNNIMQLRKNQEPYKRQRRKGGPSAGERNQTVQINKPRGGR